MQQILVFSALNSIDRLNSLTLGKAEGTRKRFREVISRSKGESDCFWDGRGKGK